MDEVCGPDSFPEVHFISLELYSETCSIECILGFLLGKCCSFPSFTQIFIGYNHVGKFKVRLCLSYVVSPVVERSLENIPWHRRKISLSLDNVSSLLRACIRDCNIANCVLISRKPILDRLSGFECCTVFLLQRFRYLGH